MLDGLDESPYPLRMEAAVEELLHRLDNWKIVIASSSAGVSALRRFAHFRVIELGRLDRDESRRLLEAYGVPPTDADEMIKLAGGNPFVLKLLASEARDFRPLSAPTAVSVTSAVEWTVTRAIEGEPERAKLTAILERLALSGGRDHIASLAAKSHVSEKEARRLLRRAQDYGLVVQDPDGSVALFHDLIRKHILARRILAEPFRLADLDFGSEEAERDGMLNESYVRRPSLNRILDQRRSIIVGDRGAGKSALFRRLAAGVLELDEPAGVTVCPVANSAELLHRIVDKDARLDAEALRAAWLVVVASVAASAIPRSAPKRLRRAAADIQAGLGLRDENGTPRARVLRAAVRPFSGTTLKLAVGPVNLEAQLPVGSAKPKSATVDIETFLREADDCFSESALRVVVMFDRIDETFKYDRPRQEALIQALLQAEGRVSLLESIGLVLFLRTDLFELYDIQEKTKLVSRMLTLEWSEEEWLQLLVNRLFANRCGSRTCAGLKQRGRLGRAAWGLEALFPPHIEGQPVERWLVDSVRNGNGDVSPRLAVLLLHLTRDLSTNPEAVVSTLPLFSAEAVRGAMTKLSELSYSEVVNDFKVATTFVLNCRAGKLDIFALSDVEALFDDAEGTVSEQVRLLERLGFLERIVIEDDSGTKPCFRVPKLYTRCWDYA